MGNLSIPEISSLSVFTLEGDHPVITCLKELLLSFSATILGSELPSCGVEEVKPGPPRVFHGTWLSRFSEPDVGNQDILLDC